MPQYPSVIATKTISSEIHIFECRNHPAKPPRNGTSNPELRLRGHDANGFGLSWSKFREGYIVSGSDDYKVCLWDINATPNNKVLDPMQTNQSHRGRVEDVAWECGRDNIFASCGSDRLVNVYDIRRPWSNFPMQSIHTHASTILSLAFSPINDYFVATGCANNTVNLFDRRKFLYPIHTMTHHKDEVVQVGWSPHNETILASCSYDRRLMVWDFSRIGRRQTSEDEKDGPPELLFIHGGHTSKVREFSWNPCDDWVIASVADDNMLQVWEMGEHVYTDDN